MLFGKNVGLDPSNILLDGNPTPPPQKGDRAPKFSADVYCDQTAAWIKMPLGTEVDLNQGHIVLDGDATPSPQKGSTAPNFRPISIVAKRLDGSRCHLA